MIKDLRKTAIVCTIGPASEDKIEELVKAGMTVARRKQIKSRKV